MIILTHAADCCCRIEDDPLECHCAGDYAHYDTLDDMLYDDFTFDCASCGLEVNRDTDYPKEPVATLWPWGEIRYVYCCPEHQARHKVG